MPLKYCSTSNQDQDSQTFAGSLSNIFYLFTFDCLRKYSTHRVGGKNIPNKVLINEQNDDVYTSVISLTYISFSITAIQREMKLILYILDSVKHADELSIFLFKLECRLKCLAELRVYYLGALQTPTDQPTDLEISEILIISRLQSFAIGVVIGVAFVRALPPFY